MNILFNNQMDMFIDIYERRERQGLPWESMISGRALPLPGTRMFHWCFAHKISKGGKYQKWKYAPWNIVLLHPDEHYNYDNREYRVRELPEWEWLLKERQELRSFYNQYYTKPVYLLDPEELFEFLNTIRWPAAYEIKELFT